MAKRVKGEPGETRIVDLPSDVLLLIFDRLNHADRLSISVTSKYFRFLTNEFVHRLLFKRIPSDSGFKKVFKSFPSVRRIGISSTRIFRALMAISRSQLELEGLEIYGNPSFPKKDQMDLLAGRFGRVKALKLKWFSNVNCEQVVDFIRLFPAVEELDLSDSRFWSDAGIEKLASTAPNLRAIKLDKNENLTDRSLDVLSNCANLEHITFTKCYKITIRSFCTFLHKRKNLRMLDLPGHLIFENLPDENTLALANSVSRCENLIHLSSKEWRITDPFLHVIAKSPSPLKSIEFELSGVPICYTMAGLSDMLHAFRGLIRLKLTLPPYRLVTQDEQMSELVKCLPLLKIVILNSQTGIYATLFSLIQNCPLLESISITLNPPLYRTRYTMPELITKNYSVQRIYLYPEPDTLLRTTLKSICPSWNT